MQGGGDIAVTIEADGNVRANFDGMRPITFTMRLGEADAGGQFTYSGKASGTFRTGDATPGATTTPGATGTPAGSGTWEPAAPVDWNAVRLTLRLTDPVDATILDAVPIGDYVGEAAERTGDIVDTDPMLGSGSYECHGDTILLRPDVDEDGGITWTLTRSG